MREKFELNNCSIRKKLIIIFVFCVFVPVIVTDSILYFTSKESMNNEQRTNFDHVIERVKYNLSDNLESCISVSNYLYTDENLNDLITTQYSSNIEFYEKYNNMLSSNVIKYYFNSQKVYKINIYASNNTMINSANFHNLDEKVKNTTWYKQFANNNEKMTITVEYSESNTDEFNRNSKRIISVVRKLNYFKDGIEKIIKVDMDYDDVLHKILNENMEGSLYVCNDQNILFYNKDDEYSNSDFKDLDYIENKDIYLEESLQFTGIVDPWRIIITSDKLIPIKSGNMQSILLILVVSNLIIPTIIIALVSKSLVKRVQILNNHLDKVEKEQFCTIECTQGKDEIGKLIKSYNLMVLKIKELIDVAFKEEMEKKNLQLAKNVAELKALQSQVNPHFMFNTLESIRMRSLIKNEKETADIIEKLSVLLRITINWGADYINIEDEMSFVENYLEIQKYRFGDKIAYDFKIQEECKYIKIPKLSILSFVENACVHGIEGIARNGYILVEIYLDKNELIINILDTGCGIERNKLNSIRDKIKNAESEIFTNKKGIGMLNSYMRLKKYSNNNMFFSINSVIDEGTNILIKLDINKLNRGDLL